MALIDPKEIASQLRHPHGEHGYEVAEFMAKSNRKIYELAFRNMKLFPHAEVIEIGQANGVFVPLLFNIEKNINYTGIDFSEEMTSAAIATNEELMQAGKARFIHADVIDTDLESSADVIFTVNTLYFYEHPEKFFSWMFRTLKPGGQVVLCIRSGTSMRHLPFTPYGFKLYEKADLEKFLNDAGLLEIVVEEETETIKTPAGQEIDLVNLCAKGNKSH